MKYNITERKSPSAAKRKAKKKEAKKKMEKRRENKTLHRGSEGFGLKGRQVEKSEEEEVGK